VGHLPLDVAQLRLVGEAGRHERVGEQGARGHLDRLAVAPRAATEMRGEHLAAQHVDHGAGHDLAVEGGRDAHREERDAVEEVHGPVERVDDPLQARAGLRGLVLLAEDACLGRRVAQ
jgi:hypothetical protein